MSASRLSLISYSKLRGRWRWRRRTDSTVLIVLCNPSRSKAFNGTLLPNHPKLEVIKQHLKFRG